MSTSTAQPNPHATAAKSPGEGEHAACSCGALEHELKTAGKRLLDESRGLRAELAKQVQQHPLATFGVAFAAGVLLARALRR